MRLSNGEVLLAWPLAQHIITQGWFYNDGSLHQAVDLRTQIDNMYIRPVYAAEDGTVDQTQDWDGHTRTGMQSYGNMVRIKHAPYKGSVLQTRYAHLSSYCVKYGQQVKEGDLIGFSGTTGNVFGAHLHLRSSWAASAPTRWCGWTTTSPRQAGRCLHTAPASTLYSCRSRPPAARRRPRTAPASCRSHGRAGLAGRCRRRLCRVPEPRPDGCRAVQERMGLRWCQWSRL